MNNTIWKYTLNNNNELTHIDLPLGAEVLSVETQGSEIVLYALVNPNERATQQIEVRTYATGQVIDVNITDYRFVGTVKMFNGALMYHVFYKRLS